jgi:N-acetyl-D-muramate 6-phosphate phosphatase
MSMVFRGIRAVLFDLDGTLIDSAPDLGSAANAMLVRRGLDPIPLDRYRALAGSGARGMLRVAFDIDAGQRDFELLKQEFFSEYQACLTTRTQAFEGVSEMLLALNLAGLHWGVVTNKGERFTGPLKRAMGLFETAATVISGDTTPHAKPHPEPLLEAARRLALPPEACLYVGDDLRDIQAGRAADMKTVAALYGYLGLEADVSSWGADASITSPADLLQLLELP